MQAAADAEVPACDAEPLEGHHTGIEVSYDPNRNHSVSRVGRVDAVKVDRHANAGTDPNPNPNPDRHANAGTDPNA